MGFNTSCEQVIYFDRNLLKLTAGLTITGNTGGSKPFDTKLLEHVLSEADRRDNLYRMQASAWLPGYLIGPFRYEGTRDDDPMMRSRTRIGANCGETCRRGFARLQTRVGLAHSVLSGRAR